MVNVLQQVNSEMAALVERVQPSLVRISNGQRNMTYRKIKRYFGTAAARHMQRGCNGKAARHSVPHVASAFPSQFFACIVYICAVY
jgi:hypothetical protein